MAASLYTGQVATNSTFSNSFFATFKQAMARSAHHARDNITSFTITFTNFYCNGNLEVSPGAASTVTASIEYPAGVFTQILFSASATGMISDGGSLQSDTIMLTIPDAALFWVRSFWNNTAGMVWGGIPRDSVNGEATQLAASGVTDQTMGGAVTNNSGSAVIRPASIAGQTRLASIFMPGDSIVSGFSDSYNDGQGLIGTVARSLGQSFGYINGGVNSDQAQNFLAHHTARLAAVNGAFSAVVSLYGANDFRIGNRTAAQIEANQQSIAALFSVPFYLATLPPVSTSTDGWITIGNQTVASFNAQWVLYNDWVRAGSHSWAAGYIEVADPVSSAEDSGIWAVKGNTTFYTADGVHPTPNGNYAIRDSGNILPSIFNR